MPLHRVFLSLGSNIRPAYHLKRAIAELSRIGSIERVSHVYHSASCGDPTQPDYLNAAALLLTDLDPVHLKTKVLSQIEDDLGRVRDPNNVNAARTIDIDPILCDGLVISTETLIIPDPDLLKRPFVALPVADLDGDFPHPVTGELLSAIAARVDDGTAIPIPEFSLHESVAVDC